MKLGEEPITPRERVELGLAGLAVAVGFVALCAYGPALLVWAASWVDWIKAMF